MTRQFARRLSLLLAALALTFSGLAWVALAQETEAESAPTEEAASPAMAEGETVNLNIYERGEVEIAIEPTGDNGYCTICHNQAGQSIRLADGTLLNLYVAPELLASSVHGPSEDSLGLGCLDCHGEDSFPHRGLPPADGRVYTLDSNAMCTACHEGYGEELSVGLHAQAIANGNLNAAVCTDCHGAHHIQSAEFRPEIMSGTCGDCHEETYDQWNISAHADMGPLGCATCHDYHAQTLRVGETTTDLCLNCHEDNLPELFVHQTHITAVQGSEHPVECADCHMIAEGHAEDGQMVDYTSDGIANHSMLLDATPCDTCHTDLQASGEWEQILAERVGLEAPLPTGDEDVEAAEAHGDEPTRDTSTRSAIQGLLLGLGLGVTFTIVFVTRNRAQS